MSQHNKHHIQRLTLVTDAWHPQVNGVVTTLSTLVKELQQQGIEVDVINPNDYPSFPLPSYPEIRCVWSANGMKKRILTFKPDALHIATEGSLGWWARHLAQKYKLPFTSGYHTRYPEYIRARWPIPMRWTYALLRRFHAKAEKTVVPADSIKMELEVQGFHNLHWMSRGVDTAVFNPQQAVPMDYPRPIQLYVGRIAPEKNIEAFLKTQIPGSKLVVGSGPELEKLQKKYPDVHFVGVKKGQQLAQYYASADVFVFPSKTDTFGVVNIEAIACGTPVAAYPVTGPKDIITQNLNGVVDEELNHAIQQALQLDRDRIADSIPQFTWQHACQQFLSILSPIKWK